MLLYGTFRQWQRVRGWLYAAWNGWCAYGYTQSCERRRGSLLFWTPPIRSLTCPETMPVASGTNAPISLLLSWLQMPPYRIELCSQPGIHESTNGACGRLDLTDTTYFPKHSAAWCTISIHQRSYCCCCFQRKRNDFSMSVLLGCRNPSPNPNPNPKLPYPDHHHNIQLNATHYAQIL